MPELQTLAGYFQASTVLVAKKLKIYSNVIINKPIEQYIVSPHEQQYHSEGNSMQNGQAFKIYKPVSNLVALLYRFLN